MREMNDTFLHNPARENYLLSLEEHIDCCARVARSIWLILKHCDLDLSDDRNMDALSELANITADHASAAQLRLQIETQEEILLRRSTDTPSVAS
jgi:hypothetical protein